MECVARMRRKLLAAAEDFPGDGQKSAGAAVPFGHAAETVIRCLQKRFVQGLLVRIERAADLLYTGFG